MISRIFIIGSNKQWEEEELLFAAQKYKISAEFLRPADFQVILSPQLGLAYKGKNLYLDPEHDFIIIRRSRGMFDEMQSLVLAFDALNIRHSDSFFGLTTNLNKEFSLVYAQSQILPHPLGTTLVSPGTSNAVNNFPYFPCVLKPVFGRHGEGVIIIHSAQELAKSVSKITERHILQKKIEIRSEYRIFIMYKEVLGVVEKKPSPGSQVANYAAGATFLPAHLPKHITEEAVRLSSEQGLDIAGVDIAEDTDGEFFLLEMNRCPEFKAFAKATNIPVAERILTKILDLF